MRCVALAYYSFGDRYFVTVPACTLFAKNNSQNCFLTLQTLSGSSPKNENKEQPKRLLSVLVRVKGLEPPRDSSLDPKSSASANSATPAYVVCAKLYYQKNIDLSSQINVFYFIFFQLFFHYQNELRLLFLHFQNSRYFP